MDKYNEILKNEELNKFYKIENIQNTEASELQKVNNNKPSKLEFTSDILLNDTMTSLIFSKSTGLEEYNKLERR